MKESEEIETIFYHNILEFIRLVRHKTMFGNLDQSFIKLKILFIIMLKEVIFCNKQPYQLLNSFPEVLLLTIRYTHILYE